MADGALPGFRDFYPDEFAQRAHIFRAWREVARRYAFVEYDGPPLEPLELYTRKSGDEIVGQLYAFTDKGDRQVSLRPEMTPTFARMVAARAHALRKPVRWFSIPQLFRYERAQRGRLREHFQLNVDIVGEASELADAELLSFAIDVLRTLGLTAADVRARVSDRRLLNAILTARKLSEPQIAASYAALDKMERISVAAFEELLERAGIDAEARAQIADLAMEPFDLGMARTTFAKHADVLVHLDRLEQYLEYLDALGVRAWVDVDFKIVRGLAYYTGIVFELFDAKGELRAICGGGRYDALLDSLGGVDLPAVGFGMGDVVLGELLRQRKLLPDAASEPADLFVVGGPGALAHGIGDAVSLVGTLRRAGLNVDYALNAQRYQSQSFRNQLDSARKSGARAAIYFDSGTEIAVCGLHGRQADAPRTTLAAAALLRGDTGAVQQLTAWIRTSLSPLSPPDAS